MENMRRKGCSRRLVLLTTKAEGVPPARDEALSASRCTGGGQSYRGHSGIEAHGGSELDQHDVIVQGSCTKVWVPNALGGSDKLLIAFQEVNVVFSQPHLDAAVGKKRHGRRVPAHYLKHPRFQRFMFRVP